MPIDWLKNTDGDSLTMHNMVWIGLHFLIMLAVLLKACVHKHQLDDHVPWHVRLHKTAVGLYCGALVLLVLAVIYEYVKVVQFDWDELIKNKRIDLGLGMILTLVGFALPGKAITYELGSQKILKRIKVPFQKIKVVGIATFILAIGGFVNSWNHIVWHGSAVYFNLLAHAVFVASTIIAIGGDTVRSTPFTSSTGKNYTKYYVTNMGQIAIIILAAGLGVKVVNEYYLSVDKVELQKDRAETKALLDATKNEVGIVNATLEQTSMTLVSFDSSLKVSINTMKNELPAQILGGQDQIMNRIPETFPTQFDQLNNRLDTRYIAKFNALHIRAMEDSTRRTELHKMLKTYQNTNYTQMITQFESAITGYNTAKEVYDSAYDHFLNQLSMVDGFTINGATYKPERYYQELVNQEMTQFTEAIKEQLQQMQVKFTPQADSTIVLSLTIE
ncbi:MAG: hypothetical protein JXQ90_03750 [Cyclobacteriaceae bacterium]